MTASAHDDLPPRGLTRADLMTAAEVAQLLSVPVSTVQQWGRTGALPRTRQAGPTCPLHPGHVERAILGAIELP